MEIKPDDDLDDFDLWESASFPTAKKEVDDINNNDELPRSPIYSFLGDHNSGKSQLLSCIGCHKVIENPKKKKFSFGMCYLQKHQVEVIANKLGVERKFESPGLLLVEAETPCYSIFQRRCVEIADFVIVVLDASVGLTTRHVELINVITEKSKSFAVVLNKVDVMQQLEIEKIFEQIKGLGTQYIVSVSALRGEGVPEFMDMLFHMSETLDRKLLGRRAECQVVDVKNVLGHGTLLLVVVVDGVLYAKDTVVVSSKKDPIVSKIKALWLPQNPGDKLVAEGPYDKEEEKISAGRGVLVALENQGSGHPLDLSLRVLGPKDDLRELEKKANAEAKIADLELMRLKFMFLG